MSEECRTWKEVWTERVSNLLSRRFLGFNGVLVLSYFRPEIVGQLIVVYGILVGGKVAQEWVRVDRDVKPA